MFKKLGLVLSLCSLCLALLNSPDDAVKKLQAATKDTFYNPYQSLLVTKLDTSKFDQFIADLDNYIQLTVPKNATKGQSTALNNAACYVLIDAAYIALTNSLKQFYGTFAVSWDLRKTPSQEEQEFAYKAVLTFDTSVFKPLKQAQQMLISLNQTAAQPDSTRTLLLETINVLMDVATKAKAELKTFPNVTAKNNALHRTARSRSMDLMQKTGAYYKTPQDLNFTNLTK